MTDSDRLSGYFELDGIELTHFECFAIDSLGFLIFCAAHRLRDTGDLPKTIHGLSGDQLTMLRGEAVSIAASTLLAAARDYLPIEVINAGSVVTFRIASHGKAESKGPS